MRLHIIDLLDGEYEFTWSHHHILMDGWCMSVLIEDFNRLLHAETTGKVPDLPLVPPYSDYINWLQTIDKENSTQYWKTYLAGYSQVADLPFKKNAGQAVYARAVEEFRIEGELYKRMERLCQQAGITQNTFMQGAWGYLLSCYNATQDVVFGAVVSGRPAELRGVEDMMGLFINTIPVRVNYKEGSTPLALLKMLQEQAIQSTPHHYLNLSEVQSLSELGMNLLDHILIFENYAVKHPPGVEVLKTGLSVESSEIFEQTNYNFNIIAVPSPDVLTITIHYNTNVLDRASVRRIKEHFANVIEQFIAQPGHALNTLEYITEAENKQLQSFNATEVAYPREKTITDLFEEQVQRTPGALAVTFEGKALSYRELNEASNQLAHYLQKRYAIGPGDLVGIKQERSDWMMISVLGVLKSGGAYVPVDPSYPQERIDYIEKDTNCKVCLDEKELQTFKAQQQEYSREKAATSVKPGDLVYVIYTSGSTGNPKGVLLEHSGVVNRLLWMKRELKIGTQDVFLQKTPTTFDVSVWELFLPLVSGSRLVICRPGGHKEPEYLEQVIKQQGVSIVHFVPSMLSSMLDAISWKDLKSLRHVVCSGEALTKKLEVAFKETSTAKLHNYYGPTEASVDVTAIDLSQTPTMGTEVSIGRPVDNTSIYIVDGSNRLQPPGVLGELLIGGVQVARGYLNKEALTKEKFIASPFKAGERLYKTGDLGRWLPDGSIEFTGRKDDQVKIRGYRIELGEIEYTLQKHQEIKEAVVIARKSEEGENYLVGYITATREQSLPKLQHYLKERLPDYMVPAHFVQLNVMPLNANGKTDRKALPDPQHMALVSGVEYVAGRNDSEKALIEVWSSVLKKKRIGIRENFYSLGGDSIKSIQVIARLKQKGYTLKVEQLLRTPVLEELANLMQKSTQLSDQSEIKGEVELTPVQHWFFENPEIETHAHYNQSVLLKRKERVDADALEKSLSDLLRHHDALRMVYSRTGDSWKQENLDASSKSYTLYRYDLREEQHAPVQMEKIGEQLQSSFSLEQGPLLKAVLFNLKDGDRLGLIVHHLVIDGVSWRILLEDLSSLYSAYTSGRTTTLPLKTDPFRKWALLQKEYAGGKKIERERAYWTRVCATEVQALPQDKRAKNNSSRIDSMATFSLDTKTTELLQTRVHGVYNTEINDVLLTGLGLALKEVFSCNTTVLKMEGHGREEIIGGADVSRTVGWFTSMYPFVLDVSGTLNATQALVKVKEDLRRIPGKGIGYGILKYLSPEGFEDQLRPGIVFNYLGDFDALAGSVANSGFEYTEGSLGSEGIHGAIPGALLDITGIQVKGKLNFSVRYSKNRYKASTIASLTKAYERQLSALIEALALEQTTYLTPSDLSFKKLGIKDLAKINANNDVEDVYELSPMQEGMYYHWLSGNPGALYFEQMSYRIRARALDLQHVRQAYERLIARHGILRTSFSNAFAGRVLQVVRKEVTGSFTCEKLPEGNGQQKAIEEIKLKDRTKGFDLNSPSQMRLHIVELAAGEYEFIWSHHHIIMDGWCMSRLISDFNQLLNAEATGIAADLPAVSPYSGYISWLRTLDKESSVRYWKEYLSEYSQVTEVPFKQKNGKTFYARAVEELVIEGTLYRKVEALCQQAGITHNTFIQGAWAYLLSRYSTTNDVVFGAVVSGRPAELGGVEEMIGLFINTIPVRVKYASGSTALELLKTLQEQSIQGTPHHYLNLSEVQALSEAGMNLIDHILVFENYAVMENEESLRTSLPVESAEVFEQTNYDLTITVLPSAGKLAIKMQYNANTWEASSVKRILEHFAKIIAEFAEHADQPLHTLDYLPAAEKQELLAASEITATSYPKDKTIVDLFEEQVERTPELTAVVYEKKTLSYKQLDELSNRLAHYLREEYSIGAEDLVGVKLERSEWMIVSLLAILKAGGAYVPIDPAYPQDRIDYIEQDTRCKVCLGEAELNAFRQQAENYSKEKLHTDLQPAHLAYVIYTSGSTGKPKGVMIEHENVVRLLKNDKQLFDFNSNDVWTMFHSYAFDFSVWEMYGALLFGGRLVVVPKLAAQDTSLYLEILEKEKVTVLNQTPSAFYSLSQRDEAVRADLRTRYVIFGGEALNPVKLQHWHKRYPHCKLINMYGITETTVHTTYKEISREDILLNRSNIGRPIPTMSCMILDEYKNLIPAGIAGELYVGGKGVARGYLNQAALTGERFLAHPFAKGERLYRTGDKVKQLPGGDLEYIGRIDNQVKIRGYRIELGEIEQALLLVEQIKEAVVLAKESRTNEKELVAYVVAATEQNSNGLRNSLKKLIPEYMLPAYFIQLTELPLTANGKVDKRSLPDPEGLGLTSGVEYQAPAGELEKKLVAIWETVLQRSNIGVKDDFFALGGHSLKATRLINEYEKELGARIALKELFVYTNIASQAALIASSVQTGFVEIEKTMLKESYPISDAQRRLWVLSQLEDASVAYNMPGKIHLKDIDIESFKKAIEATLERHESLRTVFRENSLGEVRQWILKQEELNFRIDVKDLKKEKNKEEKVKHYIAEDANRPFDLVNGPLLRATLLQVEDNEYIFYYNMHHIIGDGWSMEILSKDVFAYYHAYKENKAPDLKALRIHYKDYAAWQLARVGEETFNVHRNYWLTHLKGDLPLLDLPAFKTRPEVKTHNGRTLITYLDKELTRNLAKYAAGHEGTLFMGVMSALKALLYNYTGQKDLILGMQVAGRDHADLENQIGFYVNSLVLRSQLGGEDSFEEVYQKIRQTMLEAYAHQAYPFDRLVEELAQNRLTSRSALFDVTAVLQNAGEKIDHLPINGSDIDAITEHEVRRSIYDIKFEFQEQGDYLRLLVEYNTDVYEGDMIERFMRHFKSFTKLALAHPAQPINTIDYLSSDEKKELTATFNATAAAYPKGKTVVDMFSEQVNQRRHKQAVVHGNMTSSYEDLNRRSNQVAHFLLNEARIKKEGKVGLLLMPGMETIAATLGVLKAGGVYVPLDPALPEERLLFMISDTGMEVLVTSREFVELANRLQWSVETLERYICVDSKDVREESESRENAIMDQELWDHVGTRAGDQIEGGGWLSSYTGHPIPAEEMEEYALNVYKKLKPTLHKEMRVLEIGCSSGLTLSKIAPEVGLYYGTDLSPVIIANTEKLVSEKGWDHVKLKQLVAHQVAQLEEKDFDLVIINSVIQSFHGHNYLLKVIRDCVRLLREEGRIFIGDVMDMGMKKELIEDLEAFKRQNHDKGFSTKTDFSSELFVARGYFEDLASDEAEIAEVVISEKIRTIENELTKFRYDAVLHVNKKKAKTGRAKAPKKHKWQYSSTDLENMQVTDPAVKLEPRQLAYIIYTSGTTGRPKGVMIEHGALMNLCCWHNTRFFVTPEDRASLYAGLAFDASVWELFPYLACGASLYVVPQNIRLDCTELNAYFETNKITISFLPTPVAEQFMDAENKSLRYLLVGGEKLNHFLKKNYKLINNYGPTEITVVATSCEVNAHYSNIPIGKPVANTQIYLFNEAGQLVPKGVKGEICIGGSGLARGYLNQEKLTQEKFIVNPFNTSERLYRTGDLARWLPDGTLEFAGRADDQVKIRGYRIELGEIEHTLLKSEQIREAVVLAKENALGEKELVAYITSKTEQNTNELRAYLKGLLPEHMLPAYFVQLEEMPLTVNGKTDKKALPNPQGLGLRSGVDYAAPGNSIEEKLVKLWAEVLGKGSEQIGIDEGFFTIGGHSIKLVALKSKIEKTFNTRIQIASLFKYTTVRQQAEMLLEVGQEKPVPGRALNGLLSMHNRKSHQDAGQEVAVIGMAIKAPGSKNIHEFWENLRAGKEGITHFSAGKLPKDHVGANAYLDEKECFDAAFFGYLPDEAKVMDPQIRVFHETVWSALEDAGYDPLSYKGLIGLYAGAASNSEWEAYSQMWNQGKVDGFKAGQLSNKDFVNTLIAHQLNLNGSANAIDTACSTSLVAIHHAAKSILSGENHMAIAGGVAVKSKSKEEGYVYQEGMISSRDGYNRTFDKESSGTVSGEGAGAVVLKLLSEALKDGDQVYAVIKGSAINNDGHRKVGFTAPSVDGQSEVIRMAQQAAAVKPESISYVEAHGTATKLGDPVEVLALTQAFGQSKNKYCALGSVKTNVGHLDSAAGVAGFIKTVLCLKNKELVPSLHFKTPNPEINFDEGPFYVNTELKHWDKGSAPRRAGVSSFGIGGTNAHVILEEAPQLKDLTSTSTPQIITLSGKTTEALERNTSNLKEFLAKNKEINLANLAWTYQSGRRAFNYRSAFVAKDVEEATRILESADKKAFHTNRVKEGRKKIVFMFSGQGSQYAHMGWELYEDKESVFRKTMDRCFEIAAKYTAADLKGILYPGEEKTAAIHETIHTQPILFMFEYALAKHVEHYGITADVMIGHSVGEYVAACISGVLSLDDALKLVIRRGELIQALPKGAMLSVAMPRAELNAYLSGSLDVAAANTAESTVVSGDEKHISALKELLDQKGIASQKLHTSHAFHSSMMEPVLDAFAALVSEVTINAPRIPYISNLTAAEVSHTELMQGSYWSDHIRKTVRFAEGLETILSKSEVILIEMGPGKTLCSFARQQSRSAKSFAAVNLVKHPGEQGSARRHLLEGVAALWSSGASISWEKLHEGESLQKLSLPTYAFERVKYPLAKGVTELLMKVSAQKESATREPLSNWCYEPTWKLVKLRRAAEAATEDKLYLVFGHKGGMSQSLMDLPELAGVKKIRVTTAAHYKKLSETEFELNPNTYQGYAELFKDLSTHSIRPSHIVHLLTHDPDSIAKSTPEDTEKHKIFGYYSLLHITKELNKHYHALPVVLSVITNNLEKVFEDESVQPSKALMTGLSIVISQENPSIQTRLIDVPVTGAPEKELALLAGELMSTGKEKCIAYRNGMRWVKAYAALTLPTLPEGRSKIKQGGTYLITGGLSGLGFTLAAYLQQTYRANLVLTGRSRPSARDQKEKDQKKWLNLQQLEQGGAVMYFNANTSDLQAMQEVVARAEEKFGKIHGLIHAAGIVDGNSFKGIDLLSVAECEMQFEPKVRGVNVLEVLFKDKEMDFCLLTSSLSSIIGGKEFGAYAPANAYLDHVSHKGGIKNSISINFDALNFDEGLELEASLNPKEIFQVIETLLLLTPAASQVVVSLSELDERIKKWVQVNTGPAVVQKEEDHFAPVLVERSALSTAYAEPGTKTEKELSEIFRRFFGIEQVGIDDDFFELGGDSLKAMTLITRIHQRSNIQFRIKDLYELANIRHLSQRIDLLTGISQMTQERTKMSFENKIEL